jgi:hypothetical protein
MNVFTSVTGKCPSCGNSLLFLADGGYVTCSARDCEDPKAATQALNVGRKNTPHLEYEVSDRGFLSLPAIPSSYGGQVRVYESSSAEHPHIWLNAEAPKDLNKPEGEMVEAPLHLTIENAEALAEQLTWLVEQHYQNDPNLDDDNEEYDDDDCYGACGCDDE